MNIAVLRAEGTDNALQSLRSALNLNIDAHWRKGELGRRGVVREKSGFNACVADAPNTAALILGIRELLKRCVETGTIMSSSELSAQLDIGISIGEQEQFTASIVLNPEDMKLFSSIGLELCVSAYPGSDDET